jgi:hypothetical protein
MTTQKKSPRFNLWAATGRRAKIVCHGELEEMNHLAIYAGITETIYVLPDGADSPVEDLKC